MFSKQCQYMIINAQFSHNSDRYKLCFQSGQMWDFFSKGAAACALSWMTYLLCAAILFWGGIWESRLLKRIVPQILMNTGSTSWWVNNWVINQKNYGWVFLFQVLRYFLYLYYRMHWVTRYHNKYITKYVKVIKSVNKLGPSWAKLRTS